jgi:hypothetical protein
MLLITFPKMKLLNLVHFSKSLIADSFFFLPYVPYFPLLQVSIFLLFIPFFFLFFLNQKINALINLFILFLKS